MIRVEKGNVTLDGSLTELLTEYIITTQVLIDAITERTGQDVAKALVRDSLKIVFEEDEKDEPRL